MQITVYSLAVLVVFTLWISFMWDSVKTPLPLGGREASPELYYAAEGGPRVG